MDYQYIFKRYECKYIITSKQKEELMELMKDKMVPDEYGRSTVNNIYFDTPNYLLIRRSIEKPLYKEKLRIRSYGITSDEDDVFIGLKKKYESVVYKRRVSMPLYTAMDYLCRQEPLPLDNQITHEIDYVCKSYHLQPMMYLGYQREAYYGIDDHELRMTFDDHIAWRNDDLTLAKKNYDQEIIPEGYVLMEVKVRDAIPLWLCHFLSKNHIYKTSFSKYGMAYQNLMKKTGEEHYA